MSDLTNTTSKTISKSSCCGTCDCGVCSCACQKNTCRCEMNNCKCGCRKPAAQQ